ncbi:N-acetyltransferase [Streptomyces sp. NPDC006339]|uniref:N-acetyltransferase n=1 Tax=Streptomyces sp. NPDC006339 TaxID=3156755 RepID=UPI0033BCAF55
MTYRACDRCAEGVITDVVLDEPYHGTGLGTRALSHLRARYPGFTWRTTLDRRFTRDLLRRMRVPMARAGGNCTHVWSAVPASAPAGG